MLRFLRLAMLVTELCAYMHVHSCEHECEYVYSSNPLFKNCVCMT